jgi:hypothetical protein
LGTRYFALEGSKRDFALFLPFSCIGVPQRCSGAPESVNGMALIVTNLGQVFFDRPSTDRMKRTSNLPESRPRDSAGARPQKKH